MTAKYKIPAIQLIQDKNMLFYYNPNDLKKFKQALDNIIVSSIEQEHHRVSNSRP